MTDDDEATRDDAHEQTTFDIVNVDPDMATTPEEATLQDKIRDPDHPARECGYCHFHAEAGFESTAGGRPYCPSCGAIPKDEQRTRPYGEAAYE
jgi:hypothetical protein